MKEEFELTYFDDEKNRNKLKFLQPMEIMFDDERNILPESWFTFWNGDIPIGTKIKITLEVIE